MRLRAPSCDTAGPRVQARIGNLCSLRASQFDCFQTCAHPLHHVILTAATPSDNSQQPLPQQPPIMTARCHCS